MTTSTTFEPTQVEHPVPEPALPDGPAIVALVDPRVPDVLERLGEALPGVSRFLALPICVAPPPADPDAVAGMPGVIATKLYPAGLGKVGGLLAGLNLFAVISVGSGQTPPQGPLIVGGGDGSDGHPVMAGEEIGWDPELRWPTRPALMPVVNVSLGPRSPLAPLERSDPVNYATAATSVHQLTVVAAGNSYRRDDRETMSPLAEVPWVLAVGATDDEQGERLADYSSGGIEGEPESGPDLVAWGASALNQAKTGTSFAAPRVTGLATFAAAALLQLQHAAEVIGGGSVTGIPLVGYGIVDNFGEGRFPGLPRTSMPAVPPVEVDRDALAAAVRFAAEQGMELDISVRPERLRRMLLAAARPMPGYGPHLVGAGFLGDDVFRAWLEGLTGAHLVRLCATAPGPPAKPPPSEALRGLDGRLFAPGAVDLLLMLQRQTMPMWRWDVEARQAGMRPEAAIEEGWGGGPAA